MDDIKPIGTLIPPSQTEETRIARIPLAVLDRFRAVEEMARRLDAELELMRVQQHRQGGLVADHATRLNRNELLTAQHGARLNLAEVDIDDLQRRHAGVIKLIDKMRQTTDALLDTFREDASEDAG